MSGKFWILITSVLFITHVYDVQCECMPQDLKTHLDDVLLEEHMFEVKVFSPETKENELLSVINTVCSYWTNNKGKNEDELAVLKTFRIMLLHLDENKEIDNFCAKLNCTDSYMVRHINTTTFRAMYKNSCGGSVSDLKCPSKSTSLTTVGPTVKLSTTFLTTVNLFTTDPENATSLTTLVSPNITASENLTEVSSARTETIIQELKDNNQNLFATIIACSGLLVVSLVLNVVLTLKVSRMQRQYPQSGNALTSGMI
ncbi:uncharacterized protein LOC127156774 isoform X2 [Labeo rohita]|uniref:uncharacterized protein LOC127156774 isoform X2 n=1 Tax=Labeo rohita TaxID=84645 RepID=UPI0021E1D609|nr:uncharacterized protein LOC127156774 isoform X2 [Labeo rohita]